jgi:hypothetical protein
MFRQLLRICVAAALGLDPVGPAVAQSQANNTLTVQDVVGLCKDRFSEELIVAKIKQNARKFDLSRGELKELRAAGVSETVIKYLLDPSQPYTPPPPPAPPPAPAPPPVNPDPGSSPPVTVPEKQYPADDFASRIPPEPGLYHLAGDTVAKSDIKKLMGLKEAPGLGKVLLKKPKIIAYLPGPASKPRIQGGAPVFYLRLPPEAKGVEEFALLVFERKAKRREIQLDPQPDSVRQFEPLEVGPRLFRITTGKLGAGEYLFFMLGSSEPAKGSFGKGYDFGIEAPPRK